MNNLIKLLETYVRKQLEAAPGCHDWDHTFRVFNNALKIADGEQERFKIELPVIKAAALLHDIGRIEELNQNGKICHAALGFKLAPGILRECGFTDNDMIAKVAECVKRHRFRGENEKPETIEQKIIFDADKLDSIGAVGIGRAIHFSGRIGSRLHNRKEAALNSEAYSSEDSAYREYLVKLRFIPEKMLTETGKKLASERAEFMKTFFDRLNRDIYPDEADLEG